MKINLLPRTAGRAAACRAQSKGIRKVAGWFARGAWILVLLAAVLGWSVTPTAARELPGGFYPLEEQPGVGLYRKDYANGTPDFVLVVDLSAGASVNLLHGAPSENDGKKAGAQFAGPNPAFSQVPIGGYWQQYAGSQPGAFCVLNGQFFYMLESPTPLALPLKTSGTVVTEGFGFPQYPEKQLMLALWPGRADILPLTQENLYGTDAPDVLGGLTPEANKKPKNAVGRTFVGIQDANSDGAYETVMILTTQTATQAEADKTLIKLGAAKVMMLDGGGSTQLVCNGQAYIDTTRILPQAIGVAAAVQSANGANAGMVAQPAAPHPAPPATDQSAAVQAAAASSSVPVEAPPVAEASQEGQASSASQPPVIPLPDAMAISDPGDGSSQEVGTVGSAGTVAPEVGANPVDQPVAAIDPSQTVAGADEIQISSQDSSPDVSPAVSRLAQFAAPLPAGEVQNQAGFIPPSAYLPGPASAGQTGGFNPGDVLWLPALIPPFSIFILFAIRRRNRIPQW